jgi:hypothetical protein
VVEAMVSGARRSAGASRVCRLGDAIAAHPV